MWPYIVKIFVVVDFHMLSNTPLVCYTNQHLPVDVLICNGLGIFTGMQVSRHLVISIVVDTDPNWIRIKELCGSRSIFRIRIRIRAGENMINKRERCKVEEKNSLLRDPLKISSGEIIFLLFYKKNLRKYFCL